MADTIFDVLPDSEEAAPAQRSEIVRAEDGMPATVEDGLRSVEDELYKESLQVTRDTMAFREIEPSAEEPPEEWIENLGKKEAWRRFRVAQAAWLNSKEYPVGIKMGMQVASNIIRARATEKTAPKLAVNVVTLTQVGTGQYPKQEVDE